MQTALADGPQRQGIGNVARVVRTDAGVDLVCTDRSTVRVSVLASDLVRVRAAFGRPLPERDHSWAIARTDWSPVAWSLVEDDTSVRLLTGELEVVIRRQPLLIEYRDAATHELINADAGPMSFDPATGTVEARKRLGLEEHFYGLGEKAARLDKRRGTFSMWCSDTPGYVEGTDPIYQSIPFYLGLAGGRAYGVFFDNSHRTRFDFGASSQEWISYSAEGGEMNYYFFWGPSLKKVVGRYADLTGRMPLPPLWALGHQQSRWSYYPASQVEDIVGRYRAEDLPLDVVHLDIHYMSGYRVFTWDQERFPEPKRLLERLGRQGVKVVTIVDPGVKYQPAAAAGDTAAPRSEPELAAQDRNYYVFDQGLAGGHFLRRKNGELYIGEVWPGKAVFVDYTKDAAARWWGDLHRAYLDQGVAGIWTDMNEPADFIDRSGQTQGDVVFDDGGANTSYAMNRNVFALGMARATFEGLQRLRPDRRPYVITRAGYAGIQRYSTMWTGDNTSTWESLALSIPMLTTVGLSGEPFAGADIPGFIGRADGELLARWYQVGFLAPFCRNHAAIDAYDHEPWRFGKHYEDIARKYLKLRYRLLPFLYTSLEEAHRTGVPLFRPLVLNYQDDANTAGIDDEFMIGSDLLAAPILKSGQTSRLVYLPQGLWHDYWTGATVPGGEMVRADAPLDKIPLYVRGGSIIPAAPAMNHVGEKPWDLITFSIYPDAQGRASTELYEDDGLSPDYQRGIWRRTVVSYEQGEGRSVISIGTHRGSYQPAPRDFACVFRSPQSVGRVLIDGQELAALPPGGPGPGWSAEDGIVTVRIRDDGSPHRIEIR
ncbi:MAG: DUF4968 domain-containing protein [Opitutae bacterium]|nr:DUF4968 domain-containing protein [Opitutae bacterium]